MPATKVQLTGGSFQDSEGNLLANGYLIMKLAQDANIAGVGNIAAGIEIKILLDVNGSVVGSPAQSVWGVDQMLPANNYYRVTGYTAAGQPAWGPNNQQVVGSGGTFDVGTWIPNQVISWTPPLQPLVLEVNDTLAPNQSLLNFDDSATVTWSIDSNGNLTATAGGGSSFQVNETPLISSAVIDFQGPTVTNPSAGIVHIAVGGSVSGRWSGDWIGFNAAGANGSDLTKANITANFVDTSSSSVPTVPPTATQPRAHNGNAPSSGFTNSFGLTDQALNITPGILKDWFSKVALIGGTSARYWVGFSDIISVAAVFNTNTPAANFIGFRYAVGTDTTIKAVCQTSAGSQTVVDTGIAPTLSVTPQTFEIVPTAGGATMTFYINGVQVATISTNVPTTGTPMSSLIVWDGLTSGSSNAETNVHYVYALLGLTA